MNMRRKLVIALGAGVCAPSASFAQAAGKVWRVGFLAQRHVDFVDADSIFGPFTQGMLELGYAAGRNLVIEWRSAEGDASRLPELAAELVRLKVDVLALAGTPAAFAAQKATTTIPIVMIGVGDPVGNGLVKSLARPGGNSTAFSNMAAELGPKLLEILHSMVPRLKRVAVLVNPSNSATAIFLQNTQAAAQRIGVKVHPVGASTPGEMAGAFALMTRQNVEAFVMPLEALFQQERTQIAELAAKRRLPSIGGFSEFAVAGGLMSYGQNGRENFRRAAIYVDKIFKGANPGELPVEQPTTFDLVVNMKTARALGLKVPQSILIQATRVIE